VTNSIVMTLFRINTSTHNIKRQKVKAAASLGFAWSPVRAKAKQPWRAGSKTCCLRETGLGAHRSQGAPAEVTASLIVLCEGLNHQKRQKNTPWHILELLALIYVFLNIYVKRKHQLHVIFYLILLI